MSDPFPLYVNSAQLLRLKGPTNQADGTWITGGTGSVVLLDEQYANQLLVDAVALETNLLLEDDVSLWANGDPILVWLDDGTQHTTTVSSVDVALKQLTLADGIAAAAIRSKRIAKPLGNPLPLAEYGTTKTPLDFSGIAGYQAIKPLDHPGLVVGLRVTIQYLFNGGAGIDHQPSDLAVVQGA